MRPTGFGHALESSRIEGLDTSRMEGSRVEVMDHNNSGFIRQTGFGAALESSRFEGVLEGSIINNMEME